MNKKYRYYIKVRKPFIFKNNIYFEKVYNLSEDDLFYYFYVYNYNHFSINDLDVEIKDLRRNSFVSIVRKYFITIIGILILFTIFILLNRNITDIKFTNEEYYDNDVYQYVYQKLSGNKYKFITDKEINKINSEIRSVFYKYQWISVDKKGTIIYINIAKTEDDKVEISDNTPGGLYSKYDAIIKGYVIVKGVSMIKKDISVSKGDELISGKIPLYNNEVEYIHSNGYVIGEVSEYIKKEVSKREEKLIRTGKFTKIRKYYFFGRSKNIEYNQYDNYEVEYKSIFKIGKIFEIQDIYIYELKEVITEYNLEEAKEFAKSLIVDEFNLERKYVNEKILSLDMINIYLKDNTYYATFFVKMERDISFFKPYKELDNKNNIS